MYLVASGIAVPVPCPSSHPVAPARRYSSQTTAEGSVYAHTLPLARRSWSIGLGVTSTPSEISAIEDFARGDWGRGPFGFLSPQALVTNALSPAAASLGEYVLGPGLTAPTQAGTWVTPDGRAPRSLIKGNANSLFFGTAGDTGLSPVIPGRQVTASCYVSGDGAAVGIQWHDGAGSPMSTVTGNSGASGVVTRSFVTATPPAGAVSLRVYVNASTTKFTRPCLTYTSDLLEYSVGHGCAKAIVRAGQIDPAMMIDDPRYGRYASAEYTIQEVG